MRPIVEPPPSSRCNSCGGNLLFKMIEVADRVLCKQNELFVCSKRGRQHSFSVVASPYMAPSPLQLR